MKMKVLRDIIRIDEEKCDGCGSCVLACAEGAIKVVGGKARLISEAYCDGLGACLGECPQGALIIEKRASEEFDDSAVEHHMESMKKEKILPGSCPSSTVQRFDRSPGAELHDKEALPRGCNSAMVGQSGGEYESKTAIAQQSMLSHWPVQLALVPPNAPFLAGADLLLAAHCAPFAYGGFHQKFMKGKVVVCACPKLDDIRAHRQKLTDILREADIKSLTVVYMEVPCCAGLALIAQQAIAASGKNIPFRQVTVGIKGDILK